MPLRASILTRLQNPNNLHPVQWAVPRLVQARSYTADPPQGQDGASHDVPNDGRYNIRAIAVDAQRHRVNCEERNCAQYAENASKIARLVEMMKPIELREAARLKAKKDVETRLGSDQITDQQRETLRQRARQLKSDLEPVLSQLGQARHDCLSLANQLPNLSSKESQRGDEGRVVGYINEGRYSQNAALHTTSHVDIGHELDILDLQAASKTTGWGWYFFKNAGCLLEEALLRFATDHAIKYNFRRVTPPSIIKAHVISACGFHPRDPTETTQTYSISSTKQADKKKASATGSFEFNPEVSQLKLAATAELPLAGMHAKDTLDLSTLPLKYVGTSRCFRAEAGARGTAAKGLYRVHEFSKTELFAWTSPNMTSHDAAFHEILEIQSAILSDLGLECRILEMPRMELGHAAFRKRDIEAWFPSRPNKDRGRKGAWGEVTSASQCTDYQAKRLGTRLKGAEGGKKFAYTVNGTAMAAPRIVAALLETGWDPERRVVVLPEKLRPYMGGTAEIKRE